MAHICPHCDRTFDHGNNLTMHERGCLSGPIGQAVRALILSMAEDGCAPASEEYLAARTPGMPGMETFKSNYGGWTKYVESLSLRPRLVKGGNGKAAWVHIVSIVDEMRDEHELFVARIAASQHGVYGEACHEWRLRTYEKAGREYSEYYTVLR